jgi:hypothetical protein
MQGTVVAGCAEHQLRTAYSVAVQVKVILERVPDPAVKLVRGEDDPLDGLRDVPAGPGELDSRGVFESWRACSVM